MGNHITSKGKWYWKSNPDPWDSNQEEEWTPYSDDENKIIEEAYQKGKAVIPLGNYKIDIKKKIQTNSNDSSKQRPIKRVEAQEEKTTLRKDRFFSVPNRPISTNRILFETPPLLMYYHRSVLTNQINWFGGPMDQEHIKSLTELAANGILQEGKVLNVVKALDDAKLIAEELRKGSTLPLEELGMLCFKLYSRETFLYKSINKMLREEAWHESGHLAAFGSLLFEYMKEQLQNEKKVLKTFKNTVYRGAFLTKEMIEDYKKLVGDQYPFFAWYGFTSTTKNINKAKAFGNTLFVISFGENKEGLDISDFSDFPTEEEVLLNAGTEFRLDKIELDNAKGKETYTIFITNTEVPSELRPQSYY